MGSTSVRRLWIVGTLAAVLVALFLTGAIAYGDENEVEYSIEQGGDKHDVHPLEGPDPIAAFYSYGTPLGASFARTALTASETSIIFPYRDTTNDVLSLVVVHDRAEGQLGDPIQTGGRVSMDITGAPAGATAPFGDDNFPAETFTLAAGTWSGFWRWAPCCTDSAVLSDLTPDFWMEVTPNFTGVQPDSNPGVGIDQWVFLTARGNDDDSRSDDSSDNSNDGGGVRAISLELDSPVVVHAEKDDDDSEDSDDSDD